MVSRRVFKSVVLKTTASIGGGVEATKTEKQKQKRRWCSIEAGLDGKALVSGCCHNDPIIFRSDIGKLIGTKKRSCLWAFFVARVFARPYGVTKE